MEERGRSQDRFKSIHVGGTNGKGSTVAMLDSMLRQTGLKVGRYTGPHLLRWNERFHVNGRPMSDERFAELATRLRAESEDFGRRHPEFGSLTWFEFLTVMAFIHFAENDVDIAVLEVGLGGRWDATNIISSPLATAITNVDLDHTQILGETVAEFAREKAGIIKPGRTVLTAATGDALGEVLTVAKACAAPVYQCVPPDSILPLSEESSSATQTSEALRRLPCLLEGRARLSLAGSHQQLNSLVALGALLASGVTERLDDDFLMQVVSGGLGSVYWPGRMQLIDGLSLILDGAHNPAGARALRAALQEHFPDRSFLFVIGCFQNKDVPTYIRELIHPGDRVIACEASSRRAVFPADQIVEIAASEGIEAVSAEGVGQALGRALNQQRRHEMIVITGSFATVREVMLELGWQTVEDGLASTMMSWMPATYQGTKTG